MKHPPILNSYFSLEKKWHPCLMIMFFLFVISFRGAGFAQMMPSDQKAGSVIVFPYYTSRSISKEDTRLTISNVGGQKSYVHVFFIDGADCNPTDLFLCLTPNANVAFKVSEYDPEVSGWLMAVAVDSQGFPVQNNVLIGNAFLAAGAYVDNYGAEAFWGNANGLATVDNWSATLNFDGVGYDQVPNQLAAEIQSPLDVPNQKLITSSLRGDLTTGQMSGAAQIGAGLVYNGNEVPFASFSVFLNGTCQATGIVTTTNPRVPFGLSRLIPTGQCGTLKINVGAAVGLIMTPRSTKLNGIRNLHKLAFTNSTITIPVFPPIC